MDGIEEIAVVDRVEQDTIFLKWKDGTECMIADRPQIAEAFHVGEKVRVLSTSNCIGGTVKAVGRIEEKEWYEV